MIIEQLVQAGYKVERDTTRKGLQTLLDERHFRRLEKFSGAEGTCQEWLFNLMVTLANLEIKIVNA